MEEGKSSSDPSVQPEEPDWELNRTAEKVVYFLIMGTLCMGAL